MNLVTGSLLIVAIVIPSSSTRRQQKTVGAFVEMTLG